ncbi:MAG: M55 family metallopeptidase [Armatimonadetes bacterium]|nr:M55 family metallopeptidase [Armatimonadota bacterium]
MKVYVMTDLEGVAGVLNFAEWTGPGKLYYDLARKFLTLEINAAVDGFFEGGATEILVADGHGPSGINVDLLDPRVEYLRGWGAGPWPLCLDSSFDFLASIGQHAKAGTEFGHMAHTQNTGYLDLSINGVSIGEFGQIAMCASELGVRAIFGSGDAAFAQEARELVPGIESVAVKWGVKPGKGDDLSQEQYMRFTSSARHLQPERARRLIRTGALRAIQRARQESFGIIPLRAPFEKVTKLRPNAERDHKVVSRVTHPTSVIGVMNLSGQWERLEE